MTAALLTPETGPTNGSPANSPVYRPKLGSHIAALDGLRGLAILCVLLIHFSCGDAPNGKQTLIGDIYARAPQLFWFGVDLFFVLSGFLITGILFDAKNAPHFLRNFYARRVLRIFPLYYGVLFLIFVVIPLFKPLVSPGDEANVNSPWWLWLYGLNVFIAWHNRHLFVSDWITTTHFWSLAVEEQFYLVWPLVVLLVRRRPLMVGCVALLAFASALRLWLVTSNPGSSAPWLVFPCNMDALAVGSFLALAARGPGGLTAYVPWARRLAVVCGLVLFAVTEAVVLGDEELADGWFMRTSGKTVVALLFGAVLILAVMTPPRVAVGPLLVQRRAALLRQVQLRHLRLPRSFCQAVLRLVFSGSTAAVLFLLLAGRVAAVLRARHVDLGGRRLGQLAAVREAGAQAQGLLRIPGRVAQGAFPTGGGPGTGACPGAAETRRPVRRRKP